VVVLVVLCLPMNTPIQSEIMRAIYTFYSLYGPSPKKLFISSNKLNQYLDYVDALGSVQITKNNVPMEIMGCKVYTVVEPDIIQFSI
jgi:hypothetical protein